VELVVNESKCDQSIHVDEIFHGKLERIPLTSLLLNTGASFPKLRTGRPVIGSEIIFAF
jgi:hypothetical protein